MGVRGFFDDEKLKLRLPQVCWYCGSRETLSADHIWPQSRGGRDGGENLVYACRRCNSSKGSKDLLEWMAQRNGFPSLHLLRRYLKMAIEHCRANNLIDVPLADELDASRELPFSLSMISRRFPPVRELSMFVDCTGNPAAEP